MKKILFSLALVAFAFTANAQLVISANIGGSMSYGNTNIVTRISVVGDSSFTKDVPLDKTSSFSGGVKVGYKMGRWQFGLAGSYNTYSIETETLDKTIIPYPADQIPGMTTMGHMSTKGSSITIAPYVRYDVIQAGDVSLFAELNGFFNMTMDPTISAHIDNINLMSAFTLSMDSTFVRPMNSTSIGVRVVPGLSWQLSKHCGIDLYLDFLSLAYTSTTTIRLDNSYSFRMASISGETILLTETTATTSTTKETSFGGAITGSPLLTQLGQNNWVRVGFNFTF